MMAALRRLAIAAGAAILRVRAGADPGARVKADASPVTKADLAADAIIVAGLRAAFPDIPVVTEERPESHALGCAAGGGAPHFLVDPLDGTREFLAGRDAFTVNIALVAQGRPTLGVLYAPALGRLFRTTPGSGSAGGAVEETGGFDPAAEGPLRLLGAPRRPAAPSILRAVASRSHRDGATDAWLARSGVNETQAVGSSLKFGLLAAGEAAVYPRLSPIMEWDTAAGEAVLTAAGGAVVAKSGGPLRYGDPRRVNAGFIAYAPGMAPQP